MEGSCSQNCNFELRTPKRMWPSYRYENPIAAPSYNEASGQRSTSPVYIAFYWAMARVGTDARDIILRASYLTALKSAKYFMKSAVFEIFIMNKFNFWNCSDERNPFPKYGTLYVVACHEGHQKTCSIHTFHDSGPMMDV